MPRISLPPFLKKLQAACDGVEESIAHWSEDGGTFIVENSDGFEKELKKYYKGSLLTFIRQLHFYGFRKVDIKGEKWSFSHKCFVRGLPHLIYEIRRKTRTETNDGVASQMEVQALRDHVTKLNTMFYTMQNELKKTKEELHELRASVKRDSQRAFSHSTTHSLDFPLETISNGGDVVSVNKRAKVETSLSQCAKKLEADDDDSISALKLAPLDDMSELGAYAEDIDSFGCFLPFTDSTYESMTSSNNSSNNTSSNQSTSTTSSNTSLSTVLSVDVLSIHRQVMQLSGSVQFLFSKTCFHMHIIILKLVLL